jgi:myxalamid-type polyketide synthase MxaC
VAVLGADWPAVAASFGGAGPPPVLREVAAAAPAAAAAPPPTTLLERLAGAPAAARTRLLAAHVRAETLAVLGLGGDAALGARDRLFDAGLDSLMAVDLRNRLQAAADERLPATFVFDHPTIEALAAALADVIEPGGPAEPPAPEAPLAGDALREALDRELAAVDELMGDR